MVKHCTNTAVNFTDGYKVTHMKRTLLYKQCGYSTAAAVKTCLNNNTTGTAVCICLKLKDLGGKKDHIKKV